MSNTRRILAFAGSAREGSYNKKLVRVAAAGAEKAGADVTVIDLRDYTLPVYDMDLEAKEGLPENALKLKALFKEHDGFLISSPEHNGMFSTMLKNVIDWVSRDQPGDKSLECFVGKFAGLVSASPGTLGGLRGLPHLRALLAGLHTLVITNQVAVPGAAGAFNDDGSMKDEKMSARVEKVGADLAEMIRKMKA